MSLIMLLVGMVLEQHLDKNPLIAVLCAIVIILSVATEICLWIK